MEVQQNKQALFPHTLREVGCYRKWYRRWRNINDFVGFREESREKKREETIIVKTKCELCVIFDHARFKMMTISCLHQI